MDKGLPLNRITNVTVTLSARAAQGRNFGSMLIARMNDWLDLKADNEYRIARWREANER